MTAIFIVRAQVADESLKGDFDRWYQEEHLPDARAAFKAKRAWRGWSTTEATVHYALDAASAQAILGSEPLKLLVAEFDRVWGDKVKRSREIVEVIQNLESSPAQFASSIRGTE